MTGSKLTLTAKTVIALAVTSGVMALVYACVVWVAYGRYGQLGVTAATVAGLVCWLSGVMGLSMMLVFRDPMQAVSGVLLGMLLRMSAGLVAGLFLQSSGSELLKAGVMGMLILFYLVGLGVETLMAWWIVETTDAARSQAARAS